MDRVPGELETAIDEMEAKIRNLIRGDETLKRQYGLLLSVDGVGERTAVKMIWKPMRSAILTVHASSAVMPAWLLSGMIPAHPCVPAPKFPPGRAKALRHFCTWLP